MAFFGNFGRTATSLLDSSPAGPDTFLRSKKISVETKASNGAKFSFNKDIADSDGKTSVDVEGEASYKHSSGINLKKVRYGTDQKFKLESELKNAFDNTAMYLKVGTVKAMQSTASIDKASGNLKYKDETGRLGLKYDDKTIAADVALDVLAGDAPALFGNVRAKLADGFSVGLDAVFRTGLDTFGNTVGSMKPADLKACDKDAKPAGGMRLAGMTSLVDPSSKKFLPFRLGAGYECDGLELSAIYSGPTWKGADSNLLELAMHNKFNDKTNFAASVKLNTDSNAYKKVLAKTDRKPYNNAVDFAVAASYELDDSTTLFSKFSGATGGAACCDSAIDMALTTKVNAAVDLTFASQVNVKDFNSSGFGMGVSISN